MIVARRQYFDAHNPDQKKEMQKKKEENIQFTIFRNTCNITKHFELTRGIFSDIIWAKFNYTP